MAGRMCALSARGMGRMRTEVWKRLMSPLDVRNSNSRLTLSCTGLVVLCGFQVEEKIEMRRKQH